MILADLSRYDDNDAAAQYDGAILNVEDPGVSAKAAIAHGAGKVVMLYSWIYPGGGRAAVQHAVAVASLVGVPVAGVWLDYEQDGVVPNDVRAARATDTGGYRFGIYAYLAMMNAQGGDLVDAIGDWPLWMAYYPGANDGSYQDWYSNTARAHGAVLHQFTSSNGTRDLSIVLDDAWFQSWTNVTAAPVLFAAKENDDMVTITLNGIAYHVWAHAGKVMYRAYAGGAPGKLATVPAASYSEGADVDMANPRPLVVEAFGHTVLFFPSADGRGEVQVTEAAPGLLQYQLI